MEIRLTRKHEIDVVMSIYARARKFMAEHGNPNQWGPTNWPPRSLIMEDIERKKSYVCVDGNRILGVFFHDKGIAVEPTYRHIEDGSWQGDDCYGVVHRIATSGEEKGVGTFCLDWAFQRCGNLRIDTHPDNKVMQDLLDRCGFSRRGIIYVLEDHYPRFAYEKLGAEPHSL